jgi:hypothetical protein
MYRQILAQKRGFGSGSKRQKDLAQADALIGAIQSHDPVGLYDALAAAAAQGDMAGASPSFVP